MFCLNVTRPTTFQVCDVLFSLNNQKGSECYVHVYFGLTEYKICHQVVCICSIQHLEQEYSESTVLSQGLTPPILLMSAMINYF